MLVHLSCQRAAVMAQVDDPNNEVGSPVQPDYKIGSPAQEEEIESIPQTRAKRNKVKPKWLKDYELS